jgi:hypothetical protein
MKLPSRRRFQLVLVSLLGTAFVGAVWGALTLGWSRLPFVEPSQVPLAPEQAQPSHPPIATLRDEMLQHFHGDTSGVFTTIPGFGWSRMPVLYQQIPFEVPYFSTGELEPGSQSGEIPAELKNAFTDTLAVFEAPLRSSAPRRTERPPTSKGDGQIRFGQSFGGAVVGGLQLRQLDLIGLTDKENPRAYSGGRTFELVQAGLADKETKKAKGEVVVAPLGGKHKVGKARRTAQPEIRALDLFEMAGAAELQQGKDIFLRHKGSVVRMLGALRAGDQCLRCHAEAEKGELLGALSYTFVDSERTLFRTGKRD